MCACTYICILVLKKVKMFTLKSKLSHKSYIYIYSIQKLNVCKIILYENFKSL